MASSLPLKIVEREAMDRTDFCDCGAPTHEEDRKPPKMRSFDSIEITTVKGLLEDGKTQRSTNLPFNIVRDTLAFNSRLVSPTEPNMRS